MSRIVVTGASGFLGRHVQADLRAAGIVVVPVGRDASGVLCNLETSDVAGLFEGTTGIVHLAGVLAQGPDTPVSDYLGPNVALTEEVLLRGAAAGASRFVFSSSRLVYPSDLGRSATEDDAPNPESAYGLSKLFAERVVEHQAERTGMQAVSLRISQLVGAGDGNRGALARFSESAFSGGPVEVAGKGLAVRDVIDVRDAARAVRLALAALSSNTVPSCLNVGGGPHTILDLAKTAARAANRGDESIEHFDVASEDTSHWSLDASLASDSIGWRPEIDLADALRHRRTNDPTLA